MNQINVGLIGAGRIGRVHAENLVYRIPEANLLSVSDVFVEAAQKLAAELSVPAAYQDHRRMLEDEVIDAVLICSSTDSHARFIEEAAAAGKQIFCEKPIALDLAKIDRALAAVEEAGVKLMVGFNRRFDPNFSRVHDVVAAGEVGEPHLLRITSRDPAPPPLASPLGSLITTTLTKRGSDAGAMPANSATWRSSSEPAEPTLRDVPVFPATR